MASDPLEEKINKIRLKNEEIKRRYEEVEADKKNAAKLNALVQLVPSDDWPERKEPPEFSSPPKNTQKSKLNKEHIDRPQQHYSGVQERHGKKDHKFAQGDGPPPDPKYNFLADSEREMRGGDDGRPDDDMNRSRNKTPRGGQRGRRGGGAGGNGGGGSRDAFFKDNRGPHAFHSKEESLPEYEAWRAERNRIDEARINRQKTAEGNWRREWDNNKTSIDKEPARRGDSNRKDSNNYDRRNNHYENDYSNRGHGGSRTYHGSQKNHAHQDYRHPHHEQQPQEYKRQQSTKAPLSPNDDRTVTATDKSIKVTVNHANQSKGPVMSVKVNSPSIAGTGRVGPRQKSRITYSSQSDADAATHELNNFSRQKSFDEKTAATNFNNQKPAPKSPFPQRKKDGNSKSPYPQRREFKNDESSPRVKSQTKASYPQRNEPRDRKQSSNYTPKQQRVQKKTQKPVDKMENISVFEDAIPSEYSPDKSFNSENSPNQIFNNGNNNIEDASSKSNEPGEESLDTSEMLGDTVKSIEIVDQSKCTKDNEIISCENKEYNEIDKNIENTEFQEDVEIVQRKENIEINENVNEIKIEDKNEDNISQENEEDIDRKKIETEMPNNVSEDIIETENNDKLLSAPELQDSEALEPKTDEILNQEHPNEELCVSILESNKSKILQNQNNEESKATANDESPEVIDLKTETTPVNIEDNIPNEKQTTNSSVTQNESLDESGITDHNVTNESITSDETKTTDIDISQNKSINDSGFEEDSDRLQSNSDASIVESTTENNIKSNSQESEKSDLMDTTKDICEKTVEICDIHSAASSETSEKNKGHTEENKNNEKTNEPLENSTKDSGVNVVKDVKESSELSKIIDLQKGTENESSENENSVKEELANVATDESKKE